MLLYAFSFFSASSCTTPYSFAQSQLALCSFRLIIFVCKVYQIFVFDFLPFCLYAVTSSSLLSSIFCLILYSHNVLIDSFSDILAYRCRNWYCKAFLYNKAIAHNIFIFLYSLELFYEHREYREMMNVVN